MSRLPYYKSYLSLTRLLKIVLYDYFKIEISLTFIEK